MEAHQESFSVGVASSDACLVESESVDTNSKGQINWPVIRTQRELAEKAELQQQGTDIHPLQGKSVGKILMHYGVIDENDLRIALAMQKMPEHKTETLGEILVGVGLVKQDELIRTLLIQAGIPMVDVLSKDIFSKVAQVIPHEKAREKMAVPLGKYHGMLYLAVADPFSFAHKSFFTLMAGMKICLVYAPLREISSFLNKNKFANQSTGASKEEFHNQAKRSIDSSQAQTVTMEPLSINVSEHDSIIVNLVNQMILNAIQEEASDIHIEIFNNDGESSIRFRRDGNLEHFANFPRAYHKAVVSRIKIMSRLDISEMRRPQDGKISFDMPNVGSINLRVATIPTMPGVEFVTMRVLSSGEPLTLGSLGMSKQSMTVFREVFHQPYGLILVCGPTGSGKTTTLHSIIKELNTEHRKIWTVEDPVEIVQPQLGQIQVNAQAGMTFAAVLRSLLRADPDVIMIGEMRDHETAKIVLEASMTGHLVLSTLHANSAYETVSRLMDLGIDPYNLSDALQAILAQRLVRKLCTACARQEASSVRDIENLADEYHQSAHAKPATLEERNTIIQAWRENFGVDGNIYLKHAVGCKLCDRGYKGRIGIYEVLQATPLQRHLIRQRAAASEYLAAGVADGMLTLKQDGIEKVIRGITDIMQVRAVCI